MVDSSVARRYARALFALGLADDRSEQYGEEISAVLSATRQNRELGFMLANPGLFDSSSARRRWTRWPPRWASRP